MIVGDGTNISWTDATWNVITGCSIASAGCKLCYAMHLAGTRLRNHPSRAGLTKSAKSGPVWTGEVRFNEQWLRQPLLWRRPRLIFPVAHGDLFHPAVPDEWIDRVFAVMALSQRHLFQSLTKRPERALDYLKAGWRYERIYNEMGKIDAGAGDSHPYRHVFPQGMPHMLANVMIGASVEDQIRADQHIDAMRHIALAGWRTWVSYEPALQLVNWTGWDFISFMVSGGESDPAHGDAARPSPPVCHRSARDWCASHSVPYHFKQWGDWAPGTWGEWGDEVRFEPDDPRIVVPDMSDRDAWRNRVHWFGAVPYGPGAICVGKRRAGAILDGREHRAVPSLT